MPLPEQFIKAVKNAKGFNQQAFEAVHSSVDQITSIRLNRAKTNQKNLSAFLTYLLPEKVEKVPWCEDGFYLPERPSFTLDPLFHAGVYYVQEASSMFVEEVLKQTIDLSKSLKVLDLCAAPGGKSTLLQSLISNESLLVSNEVIKTRVNILSENITKWGAENVIVTNNDAKDFQRLPGYFDVILVDAPCSGSGLFRKDADAIAEWSLQNVQLCSQRQQRILADVTPSLKEGGVLIYSTCSYSEEEDEEIMDWLIDHISGESIRISIKNEWGIIETQSSKHSAFGYRFYPDKVKGEGFFIAAFRKISTNSPDRLGKKESGRAREKPKRLATAEKAMLLPFLKNADKYFFFPHNEAVLAIPGALEDEFTAVQKALYIKKAGVKLGSLTRNELIPDHELALSNMINDSLICYQADKATALQFLRKQDITLQSASKGWALITYADHPLGWVKVLQNRVNNYYPKEWRIIYK